MGPQLRWTAGTASTRDRCSTWGSGGTTPARACSAITTAGSSQQPTAATSVAGPKRMLDWMKQQMEAKYELTELGRLCTADNNVKEVE